MKVSDISEVTLPASLQGLGQITAPAGSLRRGSQNASEVKRLQKILVSFGYPLEIDGIFGPATETAVKTVQKKLGLIGTGIWDPMTAEKVNGITKSGVIEPTRAEANSITGVAQTSKLPAPTTVTAPGSVPGGELYIPPMGGSLMDRVKAFIASPNYPYYLVGGIVLAGAAAYLLFGGSKGTTPAAKPVSLGLGRVSRKRKTTKRKGPKVKGERFAPGYTREAAAYEQATRKAKKSSAKKS